MVNNRYSSRHVSVIFRVEDARFFNFSDTTALVIDVLRATTSIVTLLDAGVTKVFPAETVEQAFALHRRLDDVILCGERGGVAVEGFDYGNSPVAFDRLDLERKQAVLTTTNGTRAIEAAGNARLLLSAAIINAGGAARAALAASGDIVLLCSGTEGAFSLDDAYAAGVIVRTLLDRANNEEIAPDDSAWAAAQIASRPIDEVVNERTCKHVRTLTEKGFSADVAFSFRSNESQQVPRFHRTGGYFEPST